MCEYFVREETSQIERAIYWRLNFLKSEHFCEHTKFGENFWCEYFKILVLKKRVKRLFPRSKKSREKKTMPKKSRGIILTTFPKNSKKMGKSPTI